MCRGTSPRAFKGEAQASPTQTGSHLTAVRNAKTHSIFNALLII